MSRAGGYGVFIVSVALCLAGWLTLLNLEAGASDNERGDLAHLLQMMPPDGPAARYGNVALRNRSSRKGMAPVLFPHWLHRAKYSCRVCHLELDFSMPRGGSGISRGGNLAGRHCGACHDGRMAFSVRQEDRHCDRCHVKDLKTLDKKFMAFAETMPRKKFGDTIDWVKALEEGIINPKQSLYNEVEKMDVPDTLRKVLILGAGRSETIFSHEKHMEWLDCANCHPQIFNIKKKGTEAFSMDKNLYGWFCGTCHLRVSLPMSDCSGCHPGIRSGARGPSM
jgi:c(7)-type cytochrome triheme protein